MRTLEALVPVRAPAQEIGLELLTAVRADDCVGAAARGASHLVEDSRVTL